MKHFLIVFFLTAGTKAIAQDIEGLDLTQLEEELATDLQDQIEEMLLNQQYYNINLVSKDELLSLGTVRESTIDNFLNYRRIHGPVLSIYELKLLWNIREDEIRILANFLYVDPDHLQHEKLSWPEIKNGRSRLMVRYERNLNQQSGYLEDSSGQTAYLGDKSKMLVRYRNQRYRDYSFGFTLEKDAGEKINYNPSRRQYGFDFHSAHFMIMNRGIVKSAILGDYRLQFGQGLVFNSGYRLGFSHQPVGGLKSYDIGLRPYTSAAEFGYFRGLATTLKSGYWKYTLFYSHNTGDVNMEVNENEMIGRTRYFTGYHRTPNEIANKRNLREQNTGFNIRFNKPGSNLKGGFNLLYTHFNTFIEPKARPYNHFYFSGKQNLLGSIYFQYNWNHISFFGEYALNQGNKAFTGGMQLDINKHIVTGLLIRHFDRSFHSFYGNPVSGNARFNETGFIWSLEINPIPNLRISAFADHFYSPWLKYRAYQPSEGRKYQINGIYSISRNINIIGRLSHRSNQMNVGEPQDNYKVQEISKNTGFIELRGDIARFWFRTRVQGNQTPENGTRGFLLAQDLRYSSNKLTFTGRIAIFDNQSYDNRQYLYEHNILYAASFPAYDGRGIRRYLLIQWEFFERAVLEARYAITNYHDRNEVGSGNNLISGNSKADLGMQLRYSF